MLDIVVLTTIRSRVVWYTGAHCTEADPASVAGGSFLLAIVCDVNGCKNIIRPFSPDRLPPLIPAATGEGMGVHINLWRNLWEPHYHAQQQADKSHRDNKTSVPGSTTPSARMSWRDGGIEGRVIRKLTHVRRSGIWSIWWIAAEEHKYQCGGGGGVEKCSTDWRIRWL